MGPLQALSQGYQSLPTPASPKSSKGKEKAEKVSNLDLSLPKLHLNKKLPVNNERFPEDIILSPRRCNGCNINYIGDRTKITEEDIKLLKNSGKSQWIFKGNTFSPDAGKSLREYLCSPSSVVRSIKFVDCTLDPHFMKMFCVGEDDPEISVEEGNSKSLLSLHFEGCILSKEIGGYVRKVLEKGIYGVRSLTFVNSTLPPEALDEIVKGIVSQNNLVFPLIEKKSSKQPPEERGPVEKLCMEGCELGAFHGEKIAYLIEKSEYLKCLHLHRNHFGAGKKSFHTRLSGSCLSPPSPTINSFVNALGKSKGLTLLNLASNQIAESDCTIFYELIGRPKEKQKVSASPSEQVQKPKKQKQQLISIKNEVVTINLTNNGLDGLKEIFTHERLIIAGNSPRTSSCSEEVLKSQKILLQQSGRRSFDRKLPKSSLAEEIVEEKDKSKATDNSPSAVEKVRRRSLPGSQAQN